MSDVLYGASAVQLWLAAWRNSVCAATAGATTMGVTCALNGASNRAWLSVSALNCPVARHTIRCVRDTARRCVTLTKEDTMYHVAAGAKANVTQCENEIGRDSVRASRAR